MAFGAATEDSELLFLNVMHESSVPDRLVQRVCQNPQPVARPWGPHKFPVLTLAPYPIR